MSTYQGLKGLKIKYLSANTSDDRAKEGEVFYNSTSGKVASHISVAAVSSGTPMTTGRNFNEILRVVDSMQLTAAHPVATPVNWQKGEDVIIKPSVKNDEAKEIFPDGWKEIKPYLRKVADPSK